MALVNVILGVNSGHQAPRQRYTKLLVALKAGNRTQLLWPFLNLSTSSRPWAKVRKLNSFSHCSPHPGCMQGGQPYQHRPVLWSQMTFFPIDCLLGT